VLISLIFEIRTTKQITTAQIEKAQEAASRCIKQNFKNCD